MPGRSIAMAISENFMSTKTFLRGTDLSAEAADNGEVIEETKGLDSQLWHACAGGMVQLPVVGSKVIYFPQGHAEQAATSPIFPPSMASSGAIPCRVLSVSFLADTETDEVYARIRLHPDHNYQDSDDPPSPQVADKPASFAKTLTQSDANNGGGFSVPRYCAETIFPRLDYSVDPPVQTVLAKDVHGEVWKFRHIYRGTPRRHLLTTGWSTFVNQKKLVAGDAIVFLRSARGELCVGVRRSMRSSNGGGGGDSLCWQSSKPLQRSSRWELKPGNSDGTYPDVFSADGGSRGGTASSFVRNRARVIAKSVVEAATLAAAGQPFEVVYYPRASTAEFTVRAQAVRGALEQAWYPGMRFKMAFETEDSSRISWFMGNISAVQPADPLLFPESPWRILQVTWDEPDLLQGVSRVSPWQVELVSTLPMQLPPFSLPKKKFRISQPQELQIAESQGYSGLPMTALANNLVGQMNPWYSLSDDIPAGMQGARQERIYGLAPPDYYPHKVPGGIQDMYPQEGTKLLGPGSTDLNFSTISNYDHFTIQCNLAKGTTFANASQNESASGTIPSQSGSSNNRSAPFLLFGKAIDPVIPSTQQQNSGGSSSEGTSHQLLKDNSPPPKVINATSQSSEIQGDKLEMVQRYESRVTDGVKTTYVTPQCHPGSYSDSSCIDEIGGLKWFKEQASMLTSEKKDVLVRANGDSLIHCKIFMESEEVGRTIDLSLFSSYEELYEKLSDMFSTEKSKLSGRIVYKDLEGSTIHVGGEPYRNFMRSVKRLTILA
ncbi:hypothetical protein O6H91_16G023700 [Diphasiastrum complanatum]|nr:hypothetical protein O6H91_16G023700 [Diphasiastrum complanatum]